MTNDGTSAQMIGVTMLARLIGKSEDTVRYLERTGVIKATRDSANRRQFTAQEAQRAVQHYAKGAVA